jgi:hypothetical protein
MSFVAFSRVMRSRTLVVTLLLLLCGCARSDDNSGMFRMVLKSGDLSAELCAPRQYVDNVTRALNGGDANSFDPWGLQWRASKVGNVLEVVPLDKSKVRKNEKRVPNPDDFIQVSYHISKYNNPEPISSSIFRRLRPGKLLIDNADDRLDLFVVTNYPPQSAAASGRPREVYLMPRAHELSLRYSIYCNFNEETVRYFGGGSCSLRATDDRKLALTVRFGHGWLVHWYELAEAVERHTESLRNACLKG